MVSVLSASQPISRHFSDQLLKQLIFPFHFGSLLALVPSQLWLPSIVKMPHPKGLKSIFLFQPSWVEHLCWPRPKMRIQAIMYQLFLSFYIPASLIGSGSFECEPHTWQRYGQAGVGEFGVCLIGKIYFWVFFPTSARNGWGLLKICFLGNFVLGKGKVLWQRWISDVAASRWISPYSPQHSQVGNIKFGRRNQKRLEGGGREIFLGDKDDAYQSWGLD